MGVTSLWKNCKIFGLQLVCQCKCVAPLQYLDTVINMTWSCFASWVALFSSIALILSAPGSSACQLPQKNSQSNSPKKNCFYTYRWSIRLPTLWEWAAVWWPRRIQWINRTGSHQSTPCCVCSLQPEGKRLPGGPKEVKCTHSAKNPGPVYWNKSVASIEVEGLGWGGGSACQYSYHML